MLINIKFENKMVIMKSCCYFKNVWNGSFASGIYTMIYFSFSSLIFLIYVLDEWEYLMGRRNKPQGETIIEKGDITETHVIFNIVLLLCSVGLVASSIVMLYGLRKDKRTLLLPWIMLMIGDVCIELFYAFYFIFSKRANFDPIVGFIFTMDLFTVSLNTYCVLCVVSQYQEYRKFLKRTNQQIDSAMSIECTEHKYCDYPAITEIPISIKTNQLNRSATLCPPTSQHCKKIPTITEEKVSEVNV